MPRGGVIAEEELTRSQSSDASLEDGRNAKRSRRRAKRAADGASEHASDMGGDEFSRPATYTEPRSVTLGNDKFAGVPKISPWTGFAVMVVDTAGNRRVELGPQRVLLGFNETLETLALSTGKPKTTDRLYKTAYLQIEHNKVTDTISADTADHVRVELKVALRVNFEGENRTKWFGVSNYVKLLCDHVRSVVKAAIRRIRVEDFWAASEDHVRNIIIGQKPESGGSRPGMVFPENDMRVYDVEVLTVRIGDEKIQALLVGAQHEAVEVGIALARDERRLDATRRRESLLREELRAKAETVEHRAKISVEKIALEMDVALAQIKATIEKANRELEQQQARDIVAAAQVEAEIARTRAQADSTIETFRKRENVRLDALAKEAEAAVRQLAAVQPGFSEALLALGSQETLVKVADAMSVQSFLGGKDLPEVVAKVFAGTPLENIVALMVDRAATQPALQTGDGR